MEKSVYTGNMYAQVLQKLLAFIFASSLTIAVEDIWKNVQCDEYLQPENCNFNKPLVTIQDYDRCGPAELPLYARNYFLGWSGRGVTYRDNRDAFEKIKILPYYMRDISDNSLEITTLGQKISFPIGIAPTAFQKFAHPDGEIATARAAVAENALMIVSSFATISMDDIAANVPVQSGNFWMQLYIFKDRRQSVNIVRKARKLGFKAIVLTVDASIEPPIICDAKNSPEALRTYLPNALNQSQFEPDIVTFQDIRWLKSLTSLPIIAKGILTGDDAKRAINAGASAIYVSNHGGRQLDGSPATINALVDVMRVVNKLFPQIDVYMDSGIRSGQDVYKALGRGAKMVFVGRPILWGLAVNGEAGVRNVLDILRQEFNTTMLLSGATNPSEIRKETVVPANVLNCQINAR